MNERKVSVLAYEWHPESLQHIESALGDTSEIVFQSDPRSFEQEINRKQFDIIFMNVRPENGSTFSLLKKTHNHTPYTPIIVTSRTERAELIAVLQRVYKLDEAEPGEH